MYLINNTKRVENGKNVTEHPGATPGRSTNLEVIDYCKNVTI
jgi:hypothetical protein